MLVAVVLGVEGECMDGGWRMEYMMNRSCMYVSECLSIAFGEPHKHSSLTDVKRCVLR